MSRAGQQISQLISSLRSEGSFVQNLAVTFSGNIVAQALGFGLTPFIARIYGPEAYGVFALFLAICNSLAPIATLQFPAGFVAARNENEFYQILQLTFIALFGTTILLTAGVYFFENQLLGFLNAPQLASFVFLIPLYFFLMGLDTTLLGWNIRLKEFKRGAVAKMVSVTLSKGVTLVLGLMTSASAFGMIVGNLLAYPFESGVKLSAKMKVGAAEVFKKHPSVQLANTFRQFRSYPTYVTTGLIVSNFSSQLPVYYFSLVFTQSLVGYFALANGIIVMPLSIIIMSSTTVLLQKAAEVKQESPERLKELVGTLYSRLFLLSILPLVLFAFISDWIFTLIFGMAWQQAGVFSAFLAIGAVLSVPSQPLSVFFRLLHRERTNFIINIVFVFLKFAGLWLGVYKNSILLSIIGYSFVLIITNAVQLYYVFGMVDLSRKRLIRDVLIVITALAVVIYLKT